MLIKAAINGGRTKTEHPAVPVTPREQAAAVLECLNVGANAIHLHVRATSGLESLDAEDLAQTFAAVRSAAPHAQVGVSTGAWILNDTALRFEATSSWEIFPDFASVNFGEHGSVELADLLLSRGVGVEAGLCDEGAAQIFVNSGRAGDCFRVLIEPQQQDMAEALNTVDRIERVLESGAIMVPRLLHGTEATSWPMMREALKRDYAVRIGLEDTLVLPDGRIARDNTELVSEAVRLIKAAGSSQEQSVGEGSST
ncbi:MAG: 3-keto-5-aminohexanoate cleavage protein [Pyrinomonadaceae bacterium]